MQVHPTASPPPPLPPGPQLLLRGCRVVLCSPSGPRNIGGVLRLAANFEADPVYVVQPRCDPWADEVVTAACCYPEQLRLVVVPSLADALEGAVSSVGFTRRAGAGRVTHASLRRLLHRFPEALPPLLFDPEWEGRAGAPLALQPPSNGTSSSGGGGSPSIEAGSSSSVASVTGSESDRASVSAAGQLPVAALVFGREESGLLDRELSLCSYACSIPTGASLKQPSMNLSSAVAVVLAQVGAVLLSVVSRELAAVKQ